jgi:hypothetical protein
MSQSQEQTETDSQEKKPIEYFVNGERQTTAVHKLEVKAILAAAGFEPIGEWRLSRDSDGYEFKDPDHVVEIHRDERFTATFTGPTPTSSS